MTTVSTPHSVNQSARRYRSAVKASNSRTGCSARSAGTATIMAGGAHVNACRVQVQLGQSLTVLPCSGVLLIIRLHDYRVGVSPEGVADNVASLPNGIASGRGVTNDAVVRLPDHAMDRAIRTSVCSVFVRTTRLAMSIHPWADSPVSRLCTGRTRA